MRVLPRTADHPRMRGEDVSKRRTNRIDQGSPPHARGRRGLVLTAPRARGITPACAGKTRPRASMTSRRSDHPRMRGEDSTSSLWAFGLRGSPPHARGRLNISNSRVKFVDGSPPHARGRRCQCTTTGLYSGITPACAGKTMVPSVVSRPSGDHPRMRGEDRLRANRRSRRCGSPPHARGRRGGRSCPRRGAGITPACAGKTSARRGTRSRAGDHPRMRGEDTV